MIILTAMRREDHGRIRTYGVGRSGDGEVEIWDHAHFDGIRGETLQIVIHHHAISGGVVRRNPNALRRTMLGIVPKEMSTPTGRQGNRVTPTNGGVLRDLRLRESIDKDGEMGGIPTPVLIVVGH